ncbi:MAG: potassium channel family protein, partial [Bacteroidota bacterium]
HDPILSSPGKYKNLLQYILESFWWSVSTLTTGAVNISPATGTGKFISVIISMLGIGLVALPTGILSAAFMDRMKNKKNVRNKDICPHCGKEIN